MAACLKLHSNALREAGESTARMDSLVAWQNSSLFSEKESAALNWAESLSLIAQTHAPDADFDRLQAQSVIKSSDLTFANMKALNRVANASSAGNTGLRPGAF